MKPKSGEYASKPATKSEWLRKQYQRSHHWRKTSQEHKRRVGWMCEYPGCGRRCDVVHHLNYDHIGNELPEDLMALCNFHHDQMHRGWNVRIPANDNQPKFDFEKKAVAIANDTFDFEHFDFNWDDLEEAVMAANDNDVIIFEWQKTG
jgi:hypothetical protein